MIQRSICHLLREIHVWHKFKRTCVALLSGAVFLINPEKTKFIVFGVPQLLTRMPSPSIAFLGQELTPEPFVKDLGIILDCNFIFNQHIITLISSLLGSLCRINGVHHLFTIKEVLLLILNSLVFSKLFHCSTVWAGTSKQNIKK